MIFCKICGNELNSGSSFCKSCGEKVASPNPVVAVKNKTASWFRKKAGLIIGLFFGGFILLLVVGYLSEETSTNS
ncbi:MAG: hypothetical protein Q7K16_04160, partial [Candidatus Azambacteria bacterium]|nr:hypothetical protein [Candidatus Azambacteria bacterium]